MILGHKIALDPTPEQSAYRRGAGTAPYADNWGLQMIAEITAEGMEAPATIIADGRLHRFAPESGRGESGWYVVHRGERLTSWAYGDWRRPDFKGKGHTKPGKRLSAKEWRAHKNQLRERRAAVDTERLAVQTKAAQVARARWASLGPASPLHPYLKSKNVEPCGARQDGVNLVIAMTSVEDGKMWSWREITPDGFKHSQSEGRQRGCYFRIGELSDVYIICEGFATGASLSMVRWNTLTGFFPKTRVPTILVAGDAGNLIHIAKGVRAKHRDAIIILAADDDWLTKGNPGLTAAEKAAKAVNGILVKPWFHESGRPHDATDFNDEHRLYGVDEVQQTFREAMIKHQEKLQVNRGKAGPFDDPAEGSLPSIKFPPSNESVEFSEHWHALALVNRHADE